MSESGDENLIRYSGGYELQTDRIFTLLSNHRRRAILRVLRDVDTASVSDLSDLVSEIEYEKDIDQITSDERHTVYVSIQQTHVDALEKSKVVVDEEGRGEDITLGPNAPQVMKWVDQLDEPDVSEGPSIEAEVREIASSAVEAKVGGWREGFKEGYREGFKDATR